MVEGEEMTKSELIERVAQKEPQLAYRDVEIAVKAILEHVADCLAGGRRVEIRGFGSFSLHYRPGRLGRNPKTGEPVSLPPKYAPHFKPGKELRERVDRTYRTSLEMESRAGIATGAAPGPRPDPAPGPRSDPAPPPTYLDEHPTSGEA